MINNNKIDRNQSMIISLDEMISENSNVRVIDAYVRSLDVEKLGFHVYTNKVGRPQVAFDNFSGHFSVIRFFHVASFTSAFAQIFRICKK